MRWFLHPLIIRDQCSINHLTSCSYSIAVNTLVRNHAMRASAHHAKKSACSSASVVVIRWSASMNNFKNIKNDTAECERHLSPLPNSDALIRCGNAKTSAAGNSSAGTIFATSCVTTVSSIGKLYFRESMKQYLKSLEVRFPLLHSQGHVPLARCLRSATVPAARARINCRAPSPPRLAVTPAERPSRAGSMCAPSVAIEVSMQSRAFCSCAF